MNLLFGLLFICYGIVHILQPRFLTNRLTEKWKTGADLAYMKVVFRFSGILFVIVGFIILIVEISIFFFDR